MRIPIKVVCELSAADYGHICLVDDDGYGRCGDAIVASIGKEGPVLCSWIKRVLEWQDMTPSYICQSCEEQFINREDVICPSCREARDKLDQAAELEEMRKDES